MKPFVFVANKGKEKPESRENGLRMLYFTRLKYNESYEWFQVILKTKEKNGKTKLKIVRYTSK